VSGRFLVIVPRRDARSRPLFEKDAEVFRASTLEAAINRAQYIARSTHPTRGHALVVEVVHHFRSSESIVVSDDMAAWVAPKPEQDAAA
jgi:hypothetical protein